jgi:hypothetical protein
MRRRFACVTILTTLAVTPAVPLDRLVDIANDHWVEVTGESSVNAAPDFARVALRDEHGEDRGRSHGRERESG